MKTRIMMIAACVLLAGFNLDANAQRKKKTASVAEQKGYAIANTYSKLEVSSAFEVTMSDTVKEVMVDIEGGRHENVAIELEKNTLKISLKGRNKLKRRPRVVLPYNARLAEVELSGASTFTTPLALKADVVKIDIDDASKFHGNIVASKKVEIELSGASHFHGKVESGLVEYESKGASTGLMTGSAYIQLKLDMSGASHLDAKNFTSKMVRGEVEGASTATVHCTESLRVNINGASTLTYSGTPRDINCPTDVLSRLRRK